ncbi:hypothetical protein NFJ02_30g78010 [Pycnococcus provasolii]
MIYTSSSSSCSTRLIEVAPRRRRFESSERRRLYVFAPTAEAVREHEARGERLEDALNNVFVSPSAEDSALTFEGFDRLVACANDANYVWTIRPVKWVLRRPTAQIQHFARALTRTSLRELVQCVRMESDALMATYRSQAGVLEDAMAERADNSAQCN